MNFQNLLLLLSKFLFQSDVSVNEYREVQMSHLFASPKRLRRGRVMRYHKHALISTWLLMAGWFCPLNQHVDDDSWDNHEEEQCKNNDCNDPCLNASLTLGCWSCGHYHDVMPPWCRAVRHDEAWKEESGFHITSILTGFQSHAKIWAPDNHAVWKIKVRSKQDVIFEFYVINWWLSAVRWTLVMNDT